MTLMYQNNSYLKRAMQTLPHGFILISLMCFILGFTATGQEARLDSLKQTLHPSMAQVERIETFREIFAIHINANPDSAMRYARQAFELTEDLEDSKMHGQSIMDLTHAFYRKRDFDSTRIILLHSVPFYESSSQYDKVAACYRNLAAIGEKMQQPDTSLVYLDKCIEVLNRYPDSSILGQAYLSKGFAYRTKGFYELSIEALLASLKIFEQLGDQRRMGYATQNLGMTYSQTDRVDQSITYMKQSIDYSKKGNNMRVVGQSLNNLGLLYEDKGEYENATAAHHESIDISLRTEQPTVVVSNYFNLGKLFYKRDQLDSSLIYYNKMEVLAKDLESKFHLSTAMRKKALISLKRNKLAQASDHVQNAESFDIDFANPVDNIEIYEDLSEIHAALGHDKKALEYWKNANIIIDSVYTLKRDQQIEELALIYETEKKDAAILLLNKKAELDDSRKRSLWMGLAMLALSAGIVIYSLLQRRRREREVLEKEKELEIQKRYNLEQELEFKKKELTAKVLQLAHKNEFLQSLKTEVSQLKSSIDDSVNNASRRISRMIQHDASDDDDWEQFGKEFSSIHQDFIDQLVAKHGSFTKNELRLIALLKMKLSSKDIANTLRISSDGIKKARYRLRKKLGIESSVDLQGYLLSF